MDEAQEPETGDPAAAGPLQAPVIPAPKRRAVPEVAAFEPQEAQEGLDEEPGQAGPETSEVPESDTAPGPETAVQESTAEVATEAPADESAEVLEAAADADSPQPETEPETEPEAEPETGPQTEPEASLEDMVKGLREGEGGQEAEEGASTEAAPEDQTTAEDEDATAEEPEPLVATADADTTEAEATEEPRALRRRSARVPFYIYLGAWLVFAGVEMYLLWPLATAPFVDQPMYGPLVLAGTALVCVGPVLGLCVWWYVSAHSEPAERGGLVRAMLLRSAASMAAGVLLWWAALLLLDLHRIGALG